MEDDPLEFVQGTLAKVLDSEPIKNLLSSVTEHIGATLGDLGGIVRYYSRRNLEKIFKEWAAFERRRGRALDPADFEKIMPLLPLAAMASDEELQKRWAFLLESAATDAEGFLPSFGQTLSQLTGEEARYLDRIWKYASEPTGYLSLKRVGRDPISFLALVKIYDPGINTGINAAEWKLYKGRMTVEQVANYERLGHAELVIQDLERLGILTREPVAEPDRYLSLGDEKIPAGRSKTVLRWEYSLTQYGVKFIQAVAPEGTK